MNNRPSPAGRPTACMRAALFAAASTATTLNQSPIKFPPVAAHITWSCIPQIMCFWALFYKKRRNKTKKAATNNQTILKKTCYNFYTPVIPQILLQKVFFSFFFFLLNPIRTFIIYFK